MKRFVPAVAAVVATAAFATPAFAAKTTMGSDLSKDATITEAHGADSAFWMPTVAGKSQAMPADGQILSVTIKGTVFSEPGAAPPANLIHFQTLDPQGSGDSVKVYLSSQAFYLPIDQPNAVTTFQPENLCVRKGGYVGFNDIGGYAFGGLGDYPNGGELAPPDTYPNGAAKHYVNGAPFQIFARASGTTTNFYTKDNGTKNGAILSPASPDGAVKAGQELLMQFVLATGGTDVGPACRNELGIATDGAKQAPAPYMKASNTQRPYVAKSGTSRMGAYCWAGLHDETPCVGTMTMTWKGKKIASATFDELKSGSFFLDFRVTNAAARKALAKRGAKLPVVVTLTPTAGIPPVTIPLTIRH